MTPAETTTVALAALPLLLWVLFGARPYLTWRASHERD